MPASVYECMFLLDTNKVAGDEAAAAQQLHTVFEKHQAEILASRRWDDRKLCYPVKSHKRGLYYLMYFRTEGKNVVEIERDFSLIESILRHMVIHIDPKLVDDMLAMARDEHAVALQTVTDQPDDDILDDDRGRRDGGGRGRSRDHGPDDKD